jgi:hypothetical protein
MVSTSATAKTSKTPRKDQKKSTKFKNKKSKVIKTELKPKVKPLFGQTIDSMPVVELFNLKNAENIYHSNLFTLQLNELIKEVSITQKTMDNHKKSIDKLTSHLESMEKSPSIKVNFLKIQLKLKKF